MPNYQYHLDVPHICGETIHVEIYGNFTHGTWEEPPCTDEEWIYQDHDGSQLPLNRCMKCGVDLDCDTIFYETVQKMANNAYYDEDPGEPDYEEPPWEPSQEEWDQLNERGMRE